MLDVLFINTNKKLELRQETNGTLLLATKLLQAGFDVSILRFCEIESFGRNEHYAYFIRDIVDRILQLQPKCVSFYTLWPYYHVMLRIAKELKVRNPEIVTIFGGPQSSATAEETMLAAPYVDYICTGEGEDTVVPFFQMLLHQDRPVTSIPALYYRESGHILHNNLDVPLCDLDALPFWDDRLYTYNEDPKKLSSDSYFMPIDAGRGCPYSCTFCCTSKFWHRTYRLKSPERIIAEILYYKEKFGIRSFWFAHDAFTVNKKLVDAVCDEILTRNLDIRWQCTTRIDCITKELLLKMKKAGMVRISLGVETGSEHMQKIINKRLNLAKVREMVSFLLENGIHTNLFFMYGLPEETEEDLNQTLELLFDLLDEGVQDSTLSYCRFNPNTAITEQYMDQLVLDPGIKILSRGVYAYQGELETIRSNRALFPFHYSLETPVRLDYQYLYVFHDVYHQFPNSINYLRKLYNGDNLKFYRDFVSSNPEIFSKEMFDLFEEIKLDPLTPIRNLLDTFDQPFIPMLKELMRYDYDCRRITQYNGSHTEQITYQFNILDFKRRLPIDRYHKAETTIRFEKTGQKIKTSVIDIR